MSDIRRNADRNRAIQAMMTDGEQLKTFYRFVANNPHIALHDACQIVIERPNASVCFSFEEWNAQGRRVTKGRKGIPYYDSDGNKYFVFDVADTHGENRYRRITQPVKKILDGLDLLNGTEIAESNRGDYRIMLSGVVTYLGQNDFLTENDEIRNRLIAEGVAYSLYSTTGFPKERGITLKGYPYGLQENADLFREVQKAVEVLQQDINDAIYNKQNEVPVIDDIDEEYISDEPVIPKADEQPAIEEEKASVSPFYAKYSELQKANPDSIVVYRLGDFYEVMGEKAEQAATVLDLTLTGRDVGLPERVPMCGFPYHVADRYLGKLTESVSVVVFEPDAEPFKILSRDEARKTSELEELSPEESEELDRIFPEQEETEEQPDYVGEIDTRFPIDDDYGDEDEPTDEEIEEAFESVEEESDEETEDYDYEEDKKPTKEAKPENRGKPIWERRNRPSISSENASVNTGEDTIFFIKDYCEHYHSDVKNKNTKETNEVRALRDTEAKLRKIQIKLENLTEMRVNGEIGKQEFMSLKTKINGEMLVVEKEIDDIKQGVLDEERKTTPLISFEVFKSIAIEKLDFSKPIKQSNLVDAIVKKIVPNTAQDFKWYLNLFPREEGTEENDYEEIVVLEIDYDKAKEFREMRGAMLRKNQWKDLIIRIMA